MPVCLRDGCLLLFLRKSVKAKCSARSFKVSSVLICVIVHIRICPLHCANFLRWYCDFVRSNTKSCRGTAFPDPRTLGGGMIHELERYLRVLGDILQIGLWGDVD